LFFNLHNRLRYLPVSLAASCKELYSRGLEDNTFVTIDSDDLDVTFTLTSVILRTFYVWHWTLRWYTWQLEGVCTIQQTSSKLPGNVFKIHVLMLDVCWIV